MYMKLHHKQTPGLHRWNVYYHNTQTLLKCIYNPVPFNTNEFFILIYKSVQQINQFYYKAGTIFIIQSDNLIARAEKKQL